MCTSIEVNAPFPPIITDTSGCQSAASWARSNIGQVTDMLSRHGALLFRNFPMSLDCFDEFARGTSTATEVFQEESSPRSQIAGDVYTSTDYPASYPIQMHSEYSYCARWPMRLLFCCLSPAQEGGATPIADTRKVLAALSAVTMARFASRRVLYRRSYSPVGQVPWQVAFRTSSPATVEHYCRANGITTKWLPGDRLQTAQIEDPILRHPVTGESVWFNHAFFFNVRALEPKALRDVLLQEPEEDLHTNTYYGDGAPIAADTIEELRAAYRAATVDIVWRQGDLLMIDNMLTAHGRRSFKGTRRVVVSMADGRSRAECRTASAAIR
jgi:alpha-ketoglutarate-dependent taurine dioxygenase